MLPVFACTLPAAAVPTIRLRSEPPTSRSLLPAMGSASYQVGNHGLLRTAPSRVANWSGDIWSILDRPEPSRRDSRVRSMPYGVRLFETAARPALQVPLPDTTR